MPADPPERPTAAELKARLEHCVDRVCKGSLAAHRDDIVQAAWMRASALLERGEGSKLGQASYLWKVAHSAAMDEVRRVRRRGEVALDDEVSATAETPWVDDPEAIAASRQLGVAITGCLQEMVEDRRIAVALYLRGHGVPEASDLLGWDRKRTENLVYRGLADLRGCLTRKGFGR